MKNCVKKVILCPRNNYVNQIREAHINTFDGEVETSINKDLK
jgi:hypothetical protein